MLTSNLQFPDESLHKWSIYFWIKLEYAHLSNKVSISTGLNMPGMKLSKFVKMPLILRLRSTDITSLLFSRLVSTYKNDREPFSYISDVNFLLMYFIETISK